MHLDHIAYVLRKIPNQIFHEYCERYSTLYLAIFELLLDSVLKGNHFNVWYIDFSGGFAFVYVAQDVSSGKYYALKVSLHNFLVGNLLDYFLFSSVVLQFSYSCCNKKLS